MSPSKSVAKHKCRQIKVSPNTKKATPFASVAKYKKKATRFGHNIWRQDTARLFGGNKQCALLQHTATLFGDA